MIILLYFTFLTLNPKIEVVFDLIFFLFTGVFPGPSTMSRNRENTQLYLLNEQMRREKRERKANKR